MAPKRQTEFPARLLVLLGICFGLVLAACSSGAAVARPVPDVEGATLAELVVLHEIGLPTDSDHSIVVYEVMGTTMTGRQSEQGAPEVLTNFELEITAEQVTELVEEIQLAGILLFDNSPFGFSEALVGNCREMGRLVIDAFWDSGEGFTGVMPRATFEDLSICEDEGFNMTGDATHLLATLEEIRNG